MLSRVAEEVANHPGVIWTTVNQKASSRYLLNTNVSFGREKRR